MLRSEVDYCSPAVDGSPHSRAVQAEEAEGAPGCEIRVESEAMIPFP